MVPACLLGSMKNSGKTKQNPNQQIGPCTLCTLNVEWPGKNRGILNYFLFKVVTALKVVQSSLFSEAVRLAVL